MFKFENLHVNKAHAFVDGVLTGAVLTVTSIAIYRLVKKEREFQASLDDLKQKTTTQS